MTVNRRIGPIRRLLHRLLRKCATLLALARRALPGGRGREARLYARIEALLHGAAVGRGGRPRPILPLIPNLVREVLCQEGGYRTIFIERLGGDDRLYLAAHGLSETHLRAAVGDFRDPLRFQREALDRGSLAVICPWTGRTLASDRSLLAAESQPIFYRCVGGGHPARVFYLAVGREGTGNARLYYYLPDERLVLFFMDPHYWNGTAEIDEIRAHLIARWRAVLDYVGREQRSTLCALVDSNHFAHHLWEDLSGLARLLGAGEIGRVESLVVASEPLGPISTLFPEIPAHKIEHADYPGLIGDAMARGRCLIRFGCLTISPELAERIWLGACALAGEGVVARAAALRVDCWPVLWVTVRTGNRTWVSQIEGIAHIVNALYAEYPRLGLILDGYSIPCGRPRIAAQEERATLRDERSCIAQILTRLSPGIVSTSTVGLSMSVAIVFARSADIYLAHHGSLQHKVAWIANCPGLVHSNRGVLAGPLDRYPGLFAREDARLPVYLAPALVEDRPGARDVANNCWAFDLDNYDFEARHALEALRGLLRELKPRDLDRR